MIAGVGWRVEDLGFRVFRDDGRDATTSQKYAAVLRRARI